MSKKQYHAQWVKSQKEKGLCIRCTESAVPGRSMCEFHLEQNRKRASKKKMKRRKKGLCYDCDQPAAPGKTRCEYHLKLREDERKYRIEHHLCIFCGEPALPDKSACKEHMIQRRAGMSHLIEKRKKLGVCPGCGNEIDNPDGKLCLACAANARKRSMKRLWGDVRQKVLERDNYCCQVCGRTKNLVVHHKDDCGNHNSANPNNDPSNLITLCRNCHAAITKLRNYNTELAIELLLYPRYDLVTTPSANDPP